MGQDGVIVMGTHGRLPPSGPIHRSNCRMGGGSGSRRKSTSCGSNGAVKLGMISGIGLTRKTS